MNRHILVTGGAGFVGSHLVDTLVAAGHHVRVLDSLTMQVHGQGAPDYLSLEAELVRGDTRDVAVVRRALEGIDAVFHLAAAVGVGQSMYEIAHYVTANTQGTANLLQALLDTKIKLEKLIVASSMSIYGEGRYLCAECGDVAPPPRPNAQLRKKEWEVVCPKC